MSKVTFVDDNTVQVGGHTYSLQNEPGVFTHEQLYSVLLARATMFFRQLGDE